MYKRLFLLFVIVLIYSFANASAITVYEDNFNGNGAVNLHGLAPDINNHGGEWQVEWYQKPASESEYSTIRDFTYSTNPSIRAIGIVYANTGTTGDIDYFLLKDITDEAPSRNNSLVAHWSLNEADYDGNYLDKVASYVIQPTGLPNFTTGVRNEQQGAVMIAPSDGWGESEAFYIDTTNGFTICLWVNWSGDWQETIHIDDLVVESTESGAEYVVKNGLKADQRWQHVCVTYENGKARVYINGRLKLSEMCELPTGYEAALEIGNNLGQQIFNGAIDDIRLYNHALSQTEITQLVTGEENCIQEYSLEYDFSGPYSLPDCVVNFYDLAEFSKHWLENCTPQCSLEYDFSGSDGLPDYTVNLYDLVEFSRHWLSNGL